ncbi:hypothetical protein INT47_003721 [Mucor saturninus]|uniref:Uncharacterized protein n=1 Tax=Mucor saturninus TaxID=64648 RepID=A0A8H7QJD6_9FUNG|nr:hypothetical protein INT47_003721 [Mucor saturninus]
MESALYLESTPIYVEYDIQIANQNEWNENNINTNVPVQTNEDDDDIVDDERIESENNETNPAENEMEDEPLNAGTTESILTSDNDFTIRLAPGEWNEDFRFAETNFGKIKINSAAFVSGAAGTGKSFVLRMLQRYFRLKGYKLYPKLLLLVDEYSMISSKMLDSTNEALIKSTQRSLIMGGVKTNFCADIPQLLPIQKPQSAKKEIRFIELLDKVRLYNFDRSVIEFINEKIILKSNLPVYYLRLYTTRNRKRKFTGSNDTQDKYPVPATPDPNFRLYLPLRQQSTNPKVLL